MLPEIASSRQLAGPGLHRAGSLGSPESISHKALR